MRHVTFQITFLPVLLLFSLASCAHVISEETRQGAEKEVSFETVFNDIDPYIGKTFIWGGFIAKVRHFDEGSYIEIVQNPLNKYGEVMDTDVSQGRFLAFSARFLDPLIYEKGRIITVAGELTGKKEVTRSGKPYTYPILTLKEIHLWKKTDYPEPDYWGRDYPPYWWYDPWPYWPYWPPHRHD